MPAPCQPHAAPCQLQLHAPCGPMPAPHNDLVSGLGENSIYLLVPVLRFCGFVGPELAFFTPPLRNLSQKVAVLVLCTSKLDLSAALLQCQCVLASPHRSGTANGESSNNHGRSHQEDPRHCTGLASISLTPPPATTKSPDWLLAPQA
jgi:hypothetical protein